MDTGTRDSPRRSRLVALLVFVIALLVYLPTASRDTTHLDAYDSALGSWRIAQTGEPWLDDFDLDSLGVDTEKISKFIGEAENGHVVVKRTPGAVLAGVPAYVVMGGQDFTTTPQAITAALLSALAVLLLYLALSTMLPPSGAVLTSLAFAFATPMWTVSANGLWPHTVTVLGICGMAWGAATNRWWLTGLFGAVTLWGRVHASIIVAALGLGTALARRRPQIAIVVGVISGVGMALASVWTHWMYGRWSPTGGYQAGDVMDRVGSGDGNTALGQMTNQLGMWVAPDRGVLIWTPVLVLLAPAVWRSWRDLPDWTKWLGAGGLVYTLMQAWFSPFYGGDGIYGYRLALELVASVTPLYALSVPRAGRWGRRLLVPVLSLQFGVISLGAVVNDLFLGENTSWTEHVYVEAVKQLPILGLWVPLCVLIGVLVERVVWDRTGLGFGFGEPVRTPSADEATSIRVS
jgi:alpha-1,2-mannosyltransferase